MAWGFGVVLMIHLALPFAAGAMGIIGRPAPWWYVVPGWWDAAYIMGWEEAGREGKPRIPFPEEMKHRSG